LFTLKHLAYFVAAAEAASVTGAARALNISQPSISAALAELERRFGLQLFLRHHARGLSLTPAGRRLLGQARQLIAHANELRLSALDLAGGPGGGLAGELALGCFTTFAPLIVPGLLREFSRAHPETLVRLHEAHVQAVLDDLRGGRTELALTYDLNLGGDILFEALAEVPLHVLLPARHRLARADSVSLAELAGEPLVLLGLPQSREYFLSIFYAQRLEPRIAYETGSYEMVRGLVANGLGYALMHSRPPGSRALDGRRVAYRPVREPVRPTQLGLARLAELKPTRLAESFAAFCRRQTMTGPAPTSG
jgi:DNA-binding transcriptional LysR family regulator